jgi:Uma2 family endonuclease
LFYVSAPTEALLEPGHRTTADLVFEVISPGSAIYDRNTKADTYAALGVKELWLVDENASEIEVRQLEGAEYNVGKHFERDDVIASAVFPGLNLSVSDIFSA